ncbi:hypothetical protein GQX73_g7542 [Xylaria multiplex]|uniref:DUF676 domain-containing protein n=1 Tax=Xylaria multiplex TaxID=323545 RepID=A0A7C8IPV6_9PEZI|nr:hypothetical protein GQX73_g7542 [Xylaria multiplex]
MSPFFWRRANQEGSVAVQRRAAPQSRLLNDRIPDEGHKFDFVFIHEARPDPDKEWGSCDSTGREWPSYLPDNFPSARIFIFQYDTSWVKGLNDIVNTAHLEDAADQLLVYLHKLEKESKLSSTVVVAHGFGGLLYEKAIVKSKASEETFFTRQWHAAFLFGTPHLGAGIAEWAIILAKSWNIRCAKTPQSQDWSNLKAEISKTADMQRAFWEILQDIETRIDVIGCFPTRPELHSNLILSSEWAVPPEFSPIAVDSSHSSMTELDPKGGTFKAIVDKVNSLVDSLANLIFGNLASSAFGGKARKFLPKSCLDDIISRSSIRKELEPSIDACNIKSEDETLKFIYEHARKVFATLEINDPREFAEDFAIVEVDGKEKWEEVARDARNAWNSVHDLIVKPNAAFSIEARGLKHTYGLDQNPEASELDSNLKFTSSLINNAIRRLGSDNLSKLHHAARRTAVDPKHVHLFSFQYHSNTMNGEKVKASVLVNWIHQIQQIEPEYQRDSAISAVVKLVEAKLLDIAKNLSTDEDISLSLKDITERAQGDETYAYLEEHYHKIQNNNSQLVKLD